MVLSGTNIYNAKESAERDSVLSRIEQTFKTFGFEKLKTPYMQELKESPNPLSFQILKRGDDLKRAIEKNDPYADECLRYDLTFPFAQYVSKTELPKFYRRYEIGTVWRADRAGRGRLKEFIQCDIDISGNTDYIAAQELLDCADKVFKNENIQYTIKINDKKIVNELLEKIKPIDTKKFLSILDSADKKSKEDIIKALDNINISKENIDYLFENRFEIALPDDSEISQIIPFLKDRNISFQYDLFLVRGWDYYTGIMFEFVTEKLPGLSIGGGGRYDGMIKKGKRQVPCIGLSIGFDRLMLAKDKENIKDYGITLLCYSNIQRAIEFADIFRYLGNDVEIYPNTKDELNKQIEYAKKNNRIYYILDGSNPPLRCNPSL